MQQMASLQQNAEQEEEVNEEGDVENNKAPAVETDDSDDDEPVAKYLKSHTVKIGKMLNNK